MKPPSQTRLAITQLDCTAFRNFGQVRLVVPPQPVVLVGANGSGKTNLLEGLSLLAPGRGLRRATAPELQQQGNPNPWAVVAKLQQGDDQTTLATGRDADDASGSRRLVRIDGKPASQQQLPERLALVWLVPESDRQLAESDSAKRKFLDRLVYGLDPTHAARVARYERAQAERLRLLRDGPATPAWLNALEDEMAQTGVAVAAARNVLLGRLQAALEQAGEQLAGLPRPQLTIASQQTNPSCELALLSQPAVLVEEQLRGQLAKAREADRQSGRTSAGPGRTSLAVLHAAKQQPAELCSTGEQKALLLATLLAYAAVVRQWRGTTPLLLLDEIVSHLDAERRTAVLQALLASGCQFWLTGTEAGLFRALAGTATVVSVREGQVSFSS